MLDCAILHRQRVTRRTAVVAQSLVQELQAAQHVREYEEVHTWVPCIRSAHTAIGAYPAASAALAQPLGWLAATWPTTLVHTAVALGGGLARGVDVLGLFLASTALFLVFAQVLLGLNLRKPGIPSRRNLRRMHLVLMITIVVLGIGHILLDSTTLHSLIR